MVPRKLRGELTLDALCHPPQPTKTCDVAFALGGLRKGLRVSGDRSWPNPTDTALFSTLPIRWERAFGGLADPKNPLGRGLDPWPTASGPVHYLPNVEAPTALVQRAEDRPPAAGFGAISPQWSPRRDFQGTRDQRWAMFRAPLPPEDFSPLFYQAAPSDQQLADGEFFRGDETLELWNLHPKLAHFIGALPGMRLRLFLKRRATNDAPGSFTEVPLALDTLHIETEAETVTLLWRQDVALSKPLPVEVELAYLAEEPLSEEPAPLEVHEARMGELLGPPEPTTAELIDQEIAEDRAEFKKVGLQAGFDPALMQELAAIDDPNVLLGRIIKMTEEQITKLDALTAKLKG